ncbi:hypothetical protein M0R45_030882 [Rubus argutus]|uniref:Uncharacterized protein n=1 Tax=Rubus argutus TaxID=59490 RepID=A0AAW1WCG1_RUBAR
MNKDRVLEVFAQDRFIALEVSLQRRHDRGDVGDYEVGEAQKVKSHGGDSAAGAELDGVWRCGNREGRSRGFGVVAWGPTLGELDEDQGAGPDE